MIEKVPKIKAIITLVLIPPVVLVMSIYPILIAIIVPLVLGVLFYPILVDFYKDIEYTRKYRKNNKV